MQITRAGEYGVLGMLALARRPLGDVAMLDVVAREEDVPVTFLGKIFQSLAKAGLVRSARGSGGGFCLARSASEITVLEIIEAIEGPIAIQRCLDEESGCEHASGCALCGLFSEAQDRVREVFGRMSLAELGCRHLPGGLMRSARERARQEGALAGEGDEAGAGIGVGVPISGNSVERTVMLGAEAVNTKNL